MSTARHRLMAIVLSAAVATSSSVVAAHAQDAGMPNAEVQCVPGRMAAEPIDNSGATFFVVGKDRVKVTDTGVTINLGVRDLASLITGLGVKSIDGISRILDGLEFRVIDVDGNLIENAEFKLNESDRTISVDFKAKPDNPFYIEIIGTEEVPEAKPETPKAPAEESGDKADNGAESSQPGGKQAAAEAGATGEASVETQADSDAGAEAAAPSGDAEKPDAEVKSKKAVKVFIRVTHSDNFTGCKNKEGRDPEREKGHTAVGLGNLSSIAKNGSSTLAGIGKEQLSSDNSKLPKEARTGIIAGIAAIAVIVVGALLATIGGFAHFVNKFIRR
ncbi:hypothetical protein CMUST_07720 [Corynebacterium mustelae]|uniref:Uncharacterized protein n=1 Tax=Corynebacterium mustelae TaxID=571915 RepID=A0A0G3GZB7_9CORY|nr:hypothetical protein [Corynebacterium mustelae]AKK05870.1 hypothetical protein CMUST_07720 [Corynebacterium mustelae]